MVTPRSQFQVDEATKRAVAELCRRWRIRRLALFGSAVRGDFGPESDIDVLVEFEPGATPGFALMTIQDELSIIFGRTVDLHTVGSLSKYYREAVVQEAQPIYVAA